MKGEFNWLQLSDLHFGQPNQAALWPNVRKAFFDDLKLIHDQIGPIHAVLFAGDMVYSGLADDFNRFEEEVLDRIWKELDSLGSGGAVLLATAGNHDLVRPSSEKPTSTLRQLLRPNGFAEIAEEFWHAPNEYLNLIREAFGNYQKWWSKTKYRGKTGITEGLLPGDFAASFEAGSLKVGVVGLNTTFLQLAAGNFETRLEWDVRQLHEVCGDAEDWSKKHDIRLLMTHHGPSWLTERAKDDYAEIYPAGRFATHLFGHMHETDLSSIRKGGGGVIRKWQTSSLFGMEMFGEPPKQMRRHGFIAGKIELDGSAPTIRCWPRTATKDQDGWRCIPDHTRGKLESDGGTASELLEQDIDQQRPAIADDESNDTAEESLPIDEQHSLVPIETALTAEPARERLRSIARYRPRSHEGHRAVRKEEQATFETVVQRWRVVCVVSDWGLGKEGFLGCALERIVSPLSAADIFRVNCDEAETVDKLLALAATQLGMSFQQFCTLAAVLPRSFLIFDEVPNALLTGAEQDKFKRLIRSTLDYCPDLSIVITTRQKPDAEIWRTVELQRLDAFDVREYIANHPQSPPQVADADAIERIERWSGGLPMHLDRLLELLPITGLSDILEEEMDHAPTAVGLVEPVPKALQQAVAHLTNSVNEYSRRSYKMLKVLTILAEGETLQSIKRFYPTEPFHLQNVTELMRLLLLETVSPTASADDLAANRAAKPSIEADIAKVLRIPRQVRDFVRTLISEEDRMEIIHASTELLFGRKWRDGKIRLRRELPRFTGGVGGDPGNEHIVIRSLVYEGLAKRNAATTKRAANLGLAYAEKLLSADRFRDLSVVAGELVHLLEQTEFREQCVDAAALYGKALRMTGKRQEAIRVFEDAIEQGQQYLSKESKASLLLGVALSHEMDGKLSDAADAAREALEFVHPESAHGTQARAIIIGATESGFEREKQLATLEQFARNKEYLVVANNLALDLARTGKNVEESLRLQRLVLRSRGDDYNRMRAIVDRSDLLTRLDRLSELSYKDRQLLSASYSYSYGQRLSGLFDRCHMVLWSVLFKERLWAPLLRVFRHSSFLMRIKGADEQEQRYLHELKEVDSSTFKDAERAALRTELQYLDKRRHDTEDGASPEDSHEGTTE